MSLPFYNAKTNFVEYGYWTGDLGQENTSDDETDKRPPYLDVYIRDGNFGWDFPRQHGAYGLCVWPKSDPN